MFDRVPDAANLHIQSYYVYYVFIHIKFNVTYPSSGTEVEMS